MNTWRGFVFSDEEVEYMFLTSLRLVAPMSLEEYKRLQELEKKHKYEGDK